MIRHLSWSLLLAAHMAVRSFIAPPAPDPRALVDSALTAMGGRERLTALSTFRLDGIQVDFVLGNAERAEGPWRTQYARFSELWDVEHDQIRRTMTALSGGAPPSTAESVWIVTDSVMAIQIPGRTVPGYSGFWEDYRDRTNGSPSRLLLAAAASSALTWERAVSRFGALQDVVAFPTAWGRMRIELDRRSHLPTAVEIVRYPALEFRRMVFGDGTTRIEYTNWTAQPGGLWWPMQQRYLFNGELFRDLTVSSLTPAVAAAADSFAVADSTRAAYVKSVRSGAAYFHLGDRPEPAQPGDGIVRLADNWAMTLVKQDDGVVIFEAHLSADYIKQVVAEVQRRWPGAPIKAFVLTSDPWAHLGGVRQVISMGIPIYLNGASIPFLTALSHRPFTLHPDDLSKHPRAPRFIAVSGRTEIGTGKNRIVLYPVGGAYSERMTMAYFPERRLLYGTDLVFPDRGAPGAPPLKTFLRTPAIELRRAVTREGIQVDSVFCVQASYPIYAWTDFTPTGG